MNSDLPDATLDLEIKVKYVDEEAAVNLVVSRPNDLIPGELKWCRLYHCYGCGYIRVIARNQYPILICGNCETKMSWVQLKTRYDSVNSISQWKVTDESGNEIDL